MLAIWLRNCSTTLDRDSHLPQLGPPLPKTAPLPAVVTTSSPLRTSQNCHCVYVDFFSDRKKWKLGYIKDVCFQAQSGPFNEGCDVSLPTPINQPVGRHH